MERASGSEIIIYKGSEITQCYLIFVTTLYKIPCIYLKFREPGTRAIDHTMILNTRIGGTFEAITASPM